MTSPEPTPRLVLTGLIGLGAIILLTAFKEGDTAYSKRIETLLLAEPKPLASTTGKVDFAAALKVRETRGSWLFVETKNVSGWVFEGNVADERPSHTPSAGLTKVTADSTDTVAAARPLSEAAEGYSYRHGESEAQADVEWVDAESASISDDEIVAFLIENEMGEYQQ